MKSASASASFFVSSAPEARALAAALGLPLVSRLGGLAHVRLVARYRLLAPHALVYRGSVWQWEKLPTEAELRLLLEPVLEQPQAATEVPHAMA